MKINRQHRRTARIIWQDSFAGGAPDFSSLEKKIKAFQMEKNIQKEFILEALMERISLYLRENKLKISSPNELSDGRMRQILAVIGHADRFTGGVEFVNDKSLIAGLKVEKGYDIEDYSVSRQLEILRNRLVKN